VNQFEFRLPDIGEGVHEATILEWKCGVGDSVEEGQPLVVIETDKVTAEIPSPRTGIIRGLGAGAGQTIQVGDTLVQLEVQGDEGASVVGSIESAATTTLASSREGASEKATLRPQTARRDGVEKPKATPVARRLAASEGVDLSSLRGSGPSGRILKQDILRQIVLRGNGGNGGKLSTLRKTMARNLEASWKIPAALIHDFAIVDDLVKARQSLNRDARSASLPKLSYLPFFIKAAAVSLKRYPVLNAWYEEDRQTVETREAINIGFALDSEQGLLVPVIKGARGLTLSEIQEQINLRREEALKQDIRIDSLRGGTFTVSNYGSIGGTYGRPMILPPQVAVLGIGRLHQAAVIKEGVPAAATILPLSLVFDHRVCDGAYAVHFLNSFIDLVSKPIRLLA
jgi:pyruvate dehydrogenase E2 component (dihydrolipoamide acetyltransferase)